MPDGLEPQGVGEGLWLGLPVRSGIWWFSALKSSSPLQPFCASLVLPPCLPKVSSLLDPSPCRHEARAPLGPCLCVHEASAPLGPCPCVREASIPWGPSPCLLKSVHPGVHSSYLRQGSPSFGACLAIPQGVGLSLQFCKLRKQKVSMSVYLPHPIGVARPRTAF